MKKGTFIERKRVVRLFRNNQYRKPTEEEIQQAKANGEFISQESKNEGVNLQKAQLSDQVTQAVSQVAPVKTGLSKKAKIIIASVVGAIVLVGTFILVVMRLCTCKVVKYLKEPICLKLIAFYHKDKKKMVDGMESFKKSGLEAHDFVKVKGNNVKFYFYTLAGGNNLVDFTDYDTDESYRPDAWSGTLKPTMSLSDIRKSLTRQ